MASEVYPTAPRDQPLGEALRHSITKLLMARWGKIDPSYYVLISGRVNEKDERICVNQVRKWAETIQTNWVGVSSWLQRFVAGKVCWSDYQILINNLHRNIKLLHIVPLNETAAVGALRQWP